MRVFEPVQIAVSAGAKPTLPLTVYKFVPIDVSLLDHRSWRLHSDSEMVRTPSPPWGLYGVTLAATEIDRFMDEMVVELLTEATLKHKDAIWVHTFQAALERSKDTRPDVSDLKPTIFTLELTRTNLGCAFAKCTSNVGCPISLV